MLRPEYDNNKTLGEDQKAAVKELNQAASDYADRIDATLKSLGIDSESRSVAGRYRAMAHSYLETASMHAVKSATRA